MTKQNSEIILGKIVEKRIFVIRGQRVMLDTGLADLYQVETKGLNRIVKRNLSRFPEDFMFQLTATEYESLRYHFGTSKKEKRGGRRYLPFAFTENGVAMLSSVLNSDQAIQVNVVIMRTFVRTREVLSGHMALLKRVEEVEQTVSSHNTQLKEVFKTLKEMIGGPMIPKRPIGIRSTTKE